MREFTFEKLDVFTHKGSAGNPAGLVPMTPGDMLSENEMQQLARELGGFVNETAFIHEAEDGFHLRFFSSACEVAFCGHALIGTFYRLITTNPRLLDQPELTMHVRAGALTVYNRVSEEDAVYIAAPAPQFLEREITNGEIASALGFDFYTPDRWLPEVVDAGLRTLIVPLPSLADCLSTKPVFATLRDFCAAKNIDIVHVFAQETIEKDAEYHTRVFAPKFGYLEDPATGSGNAAFAGYLIKRDAMPEHLTIEQGADRDRPNRVKLARISVHGAPAILFGGRADTTLTGTYRLR